MTIYILDSNSELCAKYLDDNSLDSMICDMAQVLCNAHFHNPIKSGFVSCSWIPLSQKKECKWTRWIRECKANYLWLVDLLYECLMEYRYRLSGHKMYKVLCWARDNVPDLPNIVKNNTHSTISIGIKDCSNPIHHTTLPLVMPEKYLKIYPFRMINVIESYQAYYLAMLNKKIHKIDDMDVCKCSICDKAFKSKKFKWTNREIPQWLQL